MLNTTITFKYMKKNYQWEFIHNLDEHGLSLDAAFLGWSARLRGKKAVQSDFCKYVISKDPVNLKCSILGK